MSYIPCSGLTGENLVKKSTVPELTVWYTGPTLLATIGKLVEREVTKSIMYIKAKIPSVKELSL